MRRIPAAHINPSVRFSPSAAGALIEPQLLSPSLVPGSLLSPVRAARFMLCWFPRRRVADGGLA